MVLCYFYLSGYLEWPCRVFLAGEQLNTHEEVDLKGHLCSTLCHNTHCLTITYHRCTSAILNTAKSSFHRFAQIQIRCVLLAASTNNWTEKWTHLLLLWWSVWSQAQVNCQEIQWILNICLSKKGTRMSWVSTIWQQPSLGDILHLALQVDHPIPVKSISNLEKKIKKV